MNKKRTETRKKRKQSQKFQPREHRWLRFYPLALSLLALSVAWILMIVHESDFLWRVQEQNLFLETPLFFRQQLVVPGGILTYAATFFTQFLYHPWLGSLLFCVWCGVLLWLVKRTFRLPMKWAPLLLVPLALVLLTDFDMGYWVFVLKLRGHFFATVIGLSLAVALTWAFRSLPVRFGMRLVFMAIVAVAGYPVAGFYSLLALLLMAVIVWRLSDMSVSQRVSATALALLLAVAVPLIFYRWVYCQTPLELLWCQGLPMYVVDKVYYAYYWPYLLLVVFLLALAFFYQSERAETTILRRPWRWGIAQCSLVLVISWACWHFWYKDANFHSELRMSACLDKADWEGVLRVAEQSEEEPTRLMVMNKNLALFKLGRAGDELYQSRDGAKDPVAPFPVRMVQVGGKMIYLQYGLPNYCYRWCMEDGVEYGWRVEYLKFFVRCALLNGERVLAQKYIDILKQTCYHREWAERQQQLLQNPAALKADPELKAILPLMSFDNNLSSDNSFIELFLINLFCHAETDHPLCSELVLISALQKKDIPTFWNAFFQYAKLHEGKPMPRHFQEAAYLYGHLEQQVDISRMPFDENVKTDYQEFISFAQKNEGMSEAQMRQIFYPRFGHTFYYNYFLMRDMKSY